MPKGFGKPTRNQQRGGTTRSFLERILETTSYRKEDQEKVYQLLDENQEKLTDAFANLIREQADLSLRRLGPREKQSYAAKLHSFAMCIADFSRGNRASNLEIAIACFGTLVKFFSQTDFPLFWAPLQSKLGSLYWERIRGDRTDNLNSALRFHRGALQVLTREAHPEGWATVQNSLGIVYSAQERFEEAITAYQAALEVWTREVLSEPWAVAQGNLGIVYVEQKHFEKAIAAFESVLKVQAREAYPEDWANTQNNLGYTHREAGQPEKAISFLELALEVWTREAYPEDWAMNQHNLGNAYSDLKQLETAFSHFRSSLEIFQPTAFPIKCLKAGRDFGKAAFTAKKWQEAIEGYSAAIEAVEVSCSWASSNQRRQEILEQAIDVYTQMVQACLNSDQSSLALEYVERSKARNLVQLFADADNALQPKGEQNSSELRKQLERLKQQIVQKQRELDNLGEESGQQTSAVRPKLEPAFLADLDVPESEKSIVGTAELESEPAPDLNQLYARQVRSELDNLQTQFDAILEELLESDPAYALTQAVRPIRFEEILAQIDDHTAIIEWYITEERFFTFVITCHSPQPEVWQSQPEDLSQLHQWQQNYLDDYRQHKYRHWANQLPARLAELAQILHLSELLVRIPQDCRQLILVPHRYLHLLPIHALPVETDQCLLDLFPDSVRYAPSCQLLQLSQKRATGSKASPPELSKYLFAIQNPTDDLSFANVEINAIQNHFAKINVLKNQQATKADWNRVKKQKDLQSATFIHFSCHSYFNFESPLRSALVLAGAKLPQSETQTTKIDHTRFIQSPERDTIDLAKCLLLEEIFGLDLRPCRLVTLSACETGLSNPKSLSDEYIGLPSGFLVAGSPSVVGSHWAVSDIATALLMIKFYENLMEQIQQSSASELSERLSISQALNQAQRWLRDVTEPELWDWLKPLSLDQERQTEIRRNLRLSSSDQPFSNPLYWAAFCAVGQ